MNVLAILPDFVKLPVAMLVAGALCFYPFTWYGASKEKDRNEVQKLTNTIEIIRDRQQTDDQVATADASALCASLGLSKHDRIECVRRMEKANTVVANIGDDTSAGSTVCGPGSITQQVRGKEGLLVPRQ